MLILPILLCLAADDPYAGFPSAAITNGKLPAKLFLPDARDGYYRGTRLDWSGQIGSLNSSRSKNSLLPSANATKAASSGKKQAGIRSSW